MLAKRWIIGSNMPVKKVAEEKCENCNPSHCCKKWGNCGNFGGGAVYGIGVFGAAFYFFPQAVGATGFVMAILKSLVWPALLVFEALKLLNL